ncbi:MAG: hypothetical protein ACK53Y_24610 [bacterium]
MTLSAPSSDNSSTCSISSCELDLSSLLSSSSSMTSLHMHSPPSPIMKYMSSINIKSRSTSTSTVILPSGAIQSDNN